MFNYVVRRILQSIPILFVVLTMVFVVVRILPGDPAVAALGDYASKEAVTRPAGKDGTSMCPSGFSTSDFIKTSARGISGNSIITGYPVTAQLMKVLPYSLELTFSAILFGFLFGIPLGIPAAVRRNSFIDYFNRVFSLMGLSIPAFYLGILLMLLFSIKFKLFPCRGRGRPFQPVEQSAPPLSSRPFPRLDHDCLCDPNDPVLSSEHPPGGLCPHRPLQGHFRTGRLIKTCLAKCTDSYHCPGRRLCRCAHRVFGHDGNCLFPARIWGASWWGPLSRGIIRPFSR